MQIGSVSVERGVLLAPMEDVSDPPFRRICRELGADIVYTEFISSEGLIRDAWRSRKKLTIYEDERPVAIQIFGGNIDVMCEAAEIAESAKPEFLDINCGCWVKNVVARQAGAALLKEPDTMVAMADALVKRSSLPVTLKTRLGWNKQSIIIIELAKKLEQTGIAALCVHCRTRDMGHSGEADWDWIYKLKQEVSMPIILNGDVRSPQDAKTAFDNTGCDAVMVGRGAIGNPFVFRQIQKYLATGELEPEPDIDERIEYCLRHLQLSIEYKGDVYGVKEFRKYYTGYLKGLYSAASVRRDVVIMDSYNAIEERLLEYQEFYHNRYAESFVQPQTDINLQANIAL